MNITTLKDSQIKDNIRRYREQNKETGGFYSLAQLLQEQHRRSKRGRFPTHETAQHIIRLSAASPDGLTTYGAIWSAFRPDEPWGLASRSEVTNALERVGYYCVRHGLPLIITLVVNGSKNELTPQAKDNIYNAWRERGLQSATDRDSFIEAQQKASRQLALEALPTEAD